MAITTSLHANTPPPKAAWLGLGYGLHRNSDGIWLRVIGVEPDGPAERAGLRAQDVITAIDGQPVTFRDHLDAMRFFMKLIPQQKVRFTVVRNSQRFVVTATTIPLPAQHYGRWIANLERLKRIQK
jgi:C-terminal processing protease CtpA/Prc